MSDARMTKRKLAKRQQEKRQEWRPISSAPKDGTRIMGSRDIHEARVTWWGKTSHVPLYGWCYGDDPENIDLWEPDEWQPL